MKIYICGKITGLPIEQAREKFTKSKQVLLKAGVPGKDIVDPMTFGIKETDDWHYAMNICLARLDKCDAMWIQKDWRDSFGARREITYGMAYNMELFFEETNDLALIRRQYAETLQS